MHSIEDKGKIKGLYGYLADNNKYIKTIFSNYFKIGLHATKIAYRWDDLELMILVKLDNSTSDSIILFTVNRLDEYRFNHDNLSLLEMILDGFKLDLRTNKISKIKTRINNE